MSSLLARAKKELNRLFSVLAVRCLALAGVIFIVVPVLAQQPSPSPARAPLDPKLPTLFLIGDSTVNNSSNGQLGWGAPIAGFFDRTKINVANRARGGRSSRTYITEGLWDQVLAEMKRGDFVLMQFGHNDGGAINDSSRARGSIRGTGEETEEIDNLITKKHEVVHTYGWYMRKYIADTKTKRATPIVLSPVPRNVWKEGTVVRAANDYGKWAAETAKAGGAWFIDLNEIVAKHYEAAGPEKVGAEYFTPVDHTHTSPAGAGLNASSVVEGVRGLKGCNLVKYLLAKPVRREEFKYEQIESCFASLRWEIAS